MKIGDLPSELYPPNQPYIELYSPALQLMTLSLPTQHRDGLLDRIGGVLMTSPTEPSLSIHDNHIITYKL